MKFISTEYQNIHSHSHNAEDRYSVDMKIELSRKDGIYYIIYWTPTRNNEGKLISIAGYKYILREEWRNVTKKY